MFKTTIIMTLYMSLCVVSFDIRSQNFVKTKNKRIVSSDASSRTSKARSGIECSAVCTSDENCCSSSYDTHSNLCKLFSTCTLITENAEGCTVTKKTPEPVPNWFFSTNLCYEWKADGDGNQCGGGVPSKLCANVNEWTTYYKDDSDIRSGGCEMKWSINSIGYHDDWFANVEVCFQWHAVGTGDDQCNGGASHLLCAPVGASTGYYRDDTDSSSKGCQMQWTLSVPVDSPQWMQNTKFCYEWYTNDNQNQCGGVSNGVSCATANSFTVPYIDHTAGSGGGCYMRWRIFVDI